MYSALIVALTAINLQPYLWQTEWKWFLQKQTLKIYFFNWKLNKIENEEGALE